MLGGKGLWVGAASILIDGTTVLVAVVLLDWFVSVDDDVLLCCSSADCSTNVNNESNDNNSVNSVDNWL